MRLLEHQGRQLLSECGTKIPKGKVVTTPNQAREIVEELAGPAVVKAQVPVGGRGKAGGITKVDSPGEAEKISQKLLGSNLKGERINSLLVVEAVQIEREFYLGVILDRSQKSPVMIFSTEGGVDIEEVAKSNPEAIHKKTIDPLIGLQSFEIREIIYKAKIDDRLLKPLSKTIRQVYEVFERYEATLVEINPLALTAAGELTALDSKVVIDDESKARKEISNLIHGEEAGATETELEKKASELGLQYVELDGNIGVIGNGAGLVMATLDVLSRKGGNPANFLDVGGGAEPKVMAEAFSLVASKSEVDGVFVNIFGGITRCDKIATGLVDSLKRSSKSLPLVVRLTGTNEKRGTEVLQNSKIETASSLEEGAERIINLIKNCV